MKLLEEERLRGAENYSADDGAAISAKTSFQRTTWTMEKKKRGNRHRHQRAVTNNGRGLTQTLVQPPPAPIVQQQAPLATFNYCCSSSAVRHRRHLQLSLTLPPNTAKLPPAAASECRRRSASSIQCRWGTGPPPPPQLRVPP